MNVFKYDLTAPGPGLCSIVFVSSSLSSLFYFWALRGLMSKGGPGLCSVVFVSSSLSSLFYFWALRGLMSKGGPGGPRDFGNKSTHIIRRP